VESRAFPLETEVALARLTALHPLRRLLQLVALACRSEEFKELEIVVLRHELAILRRQVPRPALRSADRTFLAAASRLLSRKRWSSFFVTPDTLMGLASPARGEAVDLLNTARGATADRR
jgi:hypothetical protein